MVFVLSVFEAGSVVSILPFLQVLSNPEMIQTNTMLAWAYGTFGFTNNQAFFVAMGAGVFLFTVTGLIFKAFMVWVLTRFSLMRSYVLSSRLLEGYLHQPYVWFLSRHSSDLGNSVLAEVDTTVSGSLLPAMRLIPDLLTAILLIGALFYFEPVIALGAVISLGGAYTLIYVCIRLLLLRVGASRVTANKRRFHVVQEAMGGIKELKIIGLEKDFIRRFRVAALTMARAQTTSQVLRQVPRYALEGIAFGGVIMLILVLLARGSGDGDLTTLLPTLGLIAATGMRLIPSLQQVYNRIATIRFNENTLDRIHTDLMALDKDRLKRRDAAEAVAPLRLTTELRLEEAVYAYPNTEQSALTRMSLTIPANTTVGIVGGTGAGKTTVVDVILGLLDLQDGQLIVNDEPVTTEKIRAWQKTIGYVPQQIFLTDDTVASNIAFGVAPELIDTAAVEAAAKAASLHDFIMTELPEGYQTQVGERGVRLSGGQRQRIGIARALYHNPDVLIMDEATSALDNLTERAVMEAVTNISGSKTIIMIAHRLSTVRNCDTIFLLRDGKVAAEGTYDALIEMDSQFRDMASAG
ncbi:MAG: ABC transporter ATP-binding protein [Paracoccaceae bacterium]